LSALPTPLRTLLIASLLTSGCSGDGSSGPSGPVTVHIVYHASTALDPTVSAQFGDCVRGVARTHIHPSWLNWEASPLTATATDRWEISMTNVPVDRELALRINDPNRCAQHRTGAVTENVFANDVRLTRIVDTPGSGIEPGFGFRLTATGVVIP